MRRLDEDAIIGIFQKRMRGKRHASEDVEELRLGGRRMFVNMDTMVQSTDIPPRMGLRDAARKSAAACVSDFASKGIRPRYGVISVNLPGTVSERQVREIAAGFRDASDEFGFSILGGDTNRGREIVLNVCMFGSGRGIVRRRGAKIGDLVFVSGPFGYTPIGLGSLLGRAKEGRAAARGTRLFLRPKPRRGFALGAKKYLSSSMDSSDGLSATLNVMAGQSRKRFVITDIPATREVREYAGTRRKLVDLVFYGGEEYEFAFTAHPRFRKKIAEIAREHRTPVAEIGHVAAGSGVFLERDGKSIALRGVGWSHFG